MIVIRYGKGRESIDQVMVTYRYSVTNQSITKVATERDKRQTEDRKNENKKTGDMKIDRRAQAGILLLLLLRFLFLHPSLSLISLS